MRRTVVRSFSIPPKLLKELERTAEEESRTYSELVREAIRQYLKNKQLDEMHMETLARRGGGGSPAQRPRRRATKTVATRRRT